MKGNTTASLHLQTAGSPREVSADAFAAYKDHAGAGDLDGLDPEGSQSPNAVAVDEGSGSLRDPTRAASVAKQPPSAPPLAAVMLSGASARRLGVVFVREVLATAPAEAMFFTVSFTTRGAGTMADAQFGVAEFATLLGRRAPQAGAVLVLDLSRKGRWHIHGVVMLPNLRHAEKLEPWWCRIWPTETRPFQKAQSVKRLFERDLVRVLGGHHFSRQRGGVIVPGMAALYHRAVASGAFAGPWARAVGEVGLWGAPKVSRPATGHAAPGKASTLAFAPRRAHRGNACCWCGKTYAQKGRSDQKFHPTCRRSANRALKEEMATRGESAATFRHLVEDLEEKHHLLRHDAFEIAGRQLWAGYKVPNQCSFRIADVPVCNVCKHPRANKRGAKGCGSSVCRGKRWRAANKRQLGENAQARQTR